MLVVITALMAFGVMFLSALLGFFMARRQLADDLAQIRHDEHQRLHTALQSWVLGVVDSHKARLQTLMGASSNDMKSRMAEWADGAWGARRGAAPSSPERGRDTAHLASALNSARSAITQRISQFQYEVGGPGPRQ